jgi:hypothetical protein
MDSVRSEKQSNRNDRRREDEDEYSCSACWYDVPLLTFSLPLSSYFLSQPKRCMCKIQPFTETEQPLPSLFFLLVIVVEVEKSEKIKSLLKQILYLFCDSGFIV